uniref:Uncharacterized protein n=1 Tax=Tanacetum cinerariifolium TaxID=118510 RepID=A0A6L2P334_TANCI|nr:hypothetical protein [Tanacetum cinerariifolium]
MYQVVLGYSFDKEDDADGVDCLPTEEIFVELAPMGYEKPPPKLTFYKAFFFAQWKLLIHTLVQCMSAKRTAWNEFSCSMSSVVICLTTVLITNQVDDLSSHTIKYISHVLTQKVFANMRRIGKGISGIETPLFATILVQPQANAKEEDEEDETCSTFSHKVAALEQDKVAQALEIIKLKQRKLLWVLRRMHPNRGRIEEIDVDEEITLVDMEIQDDLGAELQGRLEEKDEVNVAAKEVNVVKPTVFDDEEVTMTMAQTLIKMKAEKERLLNEQMAKTLHNKEVEQVVTREKQEQDDFKRAQELQQQKYQSLKRKPISVAQARKNIKVRPIFEREYNKVQTFLKPDRDEEPTNKRVAKETLLQESFKKLRAEVEVLGSHSTQDTPTDEPKEMYEEDVKNMLQIIPVFEFKVEALQVKYPLIDWEIYSEGSRSNWKIIRVGGITQAYWSFEDMLKDFDKEDLDALWRLAKEKFSTTMPTEDKEKASWVELKRLHDIFIFLEKDYPLTDVVLLLMLSTKLQVDEDYEMARDLVMKIFMEANKPKSRKSLDTSSK